MPHTLDELMVLAWQMECEAADRYAELADAMEVHNNRDVAALFRRLAAIEQIHARRIVADMHWKTPPPLPPTDRATWGSLEPPETTPADEVHYLMQPYQALALAHAAEQRALEFFDRLARSVADDGVRAAAEAMREEEREHVALVEEWMRKVPRPTADWADDPDPPRLSE